MYASNVEQRFGKTCSELQKELNFGAIFIIFGVNFSDMTIQIFSDVLGSKNGNAMGERRTLEDPQSVVIYSSCPDLLFPTSFPTLRFGPRSFTISLNSVFK